MTSLRGCSVTQKGRVYTPEQRVRQAVSYMEKIYGAP